MNDITALAQRMKQQAALAKEFLYVETANVLALVEALEASEKRNAELEDSECQLIQERDNAEQALADMYQAATGERPEWSNMFGFADAVDAVEQRLGYLESRTVTVKLPEPFKMAKASSGLTYYYADEVDKALADAGINVEAE